MFALSIVFLVVSSIGVLFFGIGSLIIWIDNYNPDLHEKVLKKFTTMLIIFSIVFLPALLTVCFYPEESIETVDSMSLKNCQNELKKCYSFKKAKEIEEEVSNW